MGLFNYLRNKFSSKKIEEPDKNEKNQIVPGHEAPLSSIESKEAESGLLKNDSFVDDKLSNPATQEESQEDIQENKRAYTSGLKRSNKGFMYKLRALTSAFFKTNDEYFNNLEEILIEADVGVDLSIKIIEETKKEAKINKVDNPKEINELLVEEMFKGYKSSGNDVKADVQFVSNGPTVLLIVGVNGGGKTTTIAKLGKKYKDLGKKVLFVAADTFRAGAIEQLDVWAKRIGVDLVSGPDGSDPSSLCFDGLTKAKKENYDLVIVDTAGRLQNKANLMAELSKMDRVMKKVIPEAPHEAFLIIDANTGQNGVEQAKVFKDATHLTGIVITKMDGTSKGGIILAIRDKLGIPVRFIGLGEGMKDLKEFDLDSYLYGLLIGDDE